ncbi:hypothetical protein E2C01_102291 [Portunus trituberculatus]|uniref:Uncharacterized protein n=1 Tax=Portunus trituberculatus TaxID=210409 RepID=A0A5B7KI62_PORTR|nr:hypothetical protein [Portunus trituberculatus]
MANATATRCPSSSSTSSNSLGVLYEAVVEEGEVLGSADSAGQGEACANDKRGPYSTSLGFLDSLTSRTCDSDDASMSDTASQSTPNYSEDQEDLENGKAEFLMLQNKILHHLEAKRAELEDRKRQEELGSVRLFLLYVFLFCMLCATLACYRCHLRPWLLASTVQLYGISE